MNEESVKRLFCAIYFQAYKDFIMHANVQDRGKLYDWLLNEGRVLYAPFLNKEEMRKKLNEYL